MKKLFYYAMVALLSVSSLEGCARTTTAASVEKQLTIIVMDTAQALLDGAKVEIGRVVLRTSFDGRILIEQKQLEGIKKINVSCDDYESQKVSLDGSDLIIVALTPKQKKQEPESGGTYYTLGKSGARYDRAPALSGHVMTEGLMEMEEAHPMLSSESDRMAPAGAIPNNMSAGKLTAGEVNDFSKWYFWPKVIDGTHKQFVGEWKLAPRNRYTVQVKTRSGAPIASRAVSLLDGQGNTVFQALTDNTGKAELWANLFNDKPSTDDLQIRVDDQVLPAKPWSKGLNIVELDEECDTSAAVDVVFVFDATGSMSDELRYLQVEMRDVIARAKDATGGLSIRTGAVVYRDHGDEYITRLSRLTENIKTTQAFIDKQEADGGGDFPEAVPEALMAALNSAGWDSEARARIAFLVLDAPCHQDSATLALLHEQVLNAASYGVRIVPVVCSGLKESGEYLLRAMSLVTNGTSFFLTDDSGIGLTHLKPTADSLKVEHLNDMLVRTIVEFSSMPECHGETVVDEELKGNELFIPNPFNAHDLEADPTIPHGEGVYYLVDVTGKMLGVYEGSIPTDYLPTGVYFIKTYIDGQWLTKKIFVR